MSATIQDTLAKVRAADQQRRERAESAYRAAVREAALDGDPDPDAIVVVLADSGKTADEFAADLQAFVDRLAWRAQVDAVPSLEKRRQVATARLKSLADEFERAKAAHHAACDPHLAEITAVDAGLSAARDARDRLIKTCPNPSVRETSERLAAEFRSIEAKKRDVDTMLAEHRPAATNPLKKFSEEAAAKSGRIVERLAAQLAELNARQREIEAEIAQNAPRFLEV